MLAFSSLSDTVMRIHNQERVESAYRDRLIAHDDGTNFQKYLKGLARQAHGSDGDDLISDLTQTGGLQ